LRARADTRHLCFQEMPSRWCKFLFRLPPSAQGELRYTSSSSWSSFWNTREQNVNNTVWRTITTVPTHNMCTYNYNRSPPPPPVRGIYRLRNDCLFEFRPGTRTFGEWIRAGKSVGTQFNRSAAKRSIRLAYNSFSVYCSLILNTCNDTLPVSNNKPIAIYRVRNGRGVFKRYIFLNRFNWLTDRPIR